MDQFSELQRLGQIESSEAGRVFREFLRSRVRQSLANIMAEEVRELCGPKYRPALEAEKGFRRLMGYKDRPRRWVENCGAASTRKGRKQSRGPCTQSASGEPLARNHRTGGFRQGAKPVRLRRPFPVSRLARHVFG